MSKIQINHEDVVAHPELAEFEGQTIESSEYQAIVAGKNLAPNADVENDATDENDNSSNTVENKPKKKKKNKK